MKSTIRSAFFLLVLSSLGGTAARADEVVVVMSSKLDAYQQALEGFQEAFGGAVPAMGVADPLRLPNDVRIVVAFGGKAAQAKYPKNIALVYCMAPAIKLEQSGRFGPSVQIQMLPRADAVLLRFKDIQPTMKRLAVLWASDSLEEYAEGLREASAAAGIKIFSERLDGPDEIPERLRAINGKVDALWLSPDPLLVNAQTFSVIKEFSWSNNIPFYAPTAALTEKGAAASISSSYREIGRAAAQAVRRLLSGTSAGSTIYPEKADVTVNLSAAARSGLRIENEAARRADRVIP